MKKIGQTTFSKDLKPWLGIASTVLLGVSCVSEDAVDEGLGLAKTIVEGHIVEGQRNSGRGGHGKHRRGDSVEQLNPEVAAANARRVQLEKDLREKQAALRRAQQKAAAAEREAQEKQDGSEQEARQLQAALALAQQKVREAQDEATAAGRALEEQHKNQQEAAKEAARQKNEEQRLREERERQNQETLKQEAEEALKKAEEEAKAASDKAKKEAEERVREAEEARKAREEAERLKQEAEKQKKLREEAENAKRTLEKQHERDLEVARKKAAEEQRLREGAEKRAEAERKSTKQLLVESTLEAQSSGVLEAERKSTGQLVESTLEARSSHSRRSSDGSIISEGSITQSPKSPEEEDAKGGVNAGNDHEESPGPQREEGQGLGDSLLSIPLQEEDDNSSDRFGSTMTWGLDTPNHRSSAGSVGSHVNTQDFKRLLAEDARRQCQSGDDSVLDDPAVADENIGQPINRNGKDIQTNSEEIKASCLRRLGAQATNWQAPSEGTGENSLTNETDTKRAPTPEDTKEEASKEGKPKTVNRGRRQEKVKKKYRSLSETRVRKFSRRSKKRAKTPTDGRRSLVRISVTGPDKNTTRSLSDLPAQS